MNNYNYNILISRLDTRRYKMKMLKCIDFIVDLI